MKTESKKVPVALRLKLVITRELKERSRLTGVSQARIVEDALTYWFQGEMRKQLARTVEKIRSFSRAPDGSSGHEFMAA